MNSKMNRKDVQLLLKNKEIRNDLLETLLYFQKKSYDEDNHLEETIQRLENEKIKSSPIEHSLIKNQLDLLEGQLLINFPDIKENYENKIIVRRKSPVKRRIESQTKSYSQNLLKNMVYSQYELQKKAGIQEAQTLEKPYLQQKKDIAGRNEQITDDNADFLKQLEHLTKQKRVKKSIINIKYYDGLLTALKTLNSEIKESDLSNTINAIENGFLKIKDPILANSFNKALKILEE
ncbi:MAG: hypothetical protein ACW981_11665 [Candidatus Hodarchaeales archaeon]|jgi:hypothetical protein